MKPLIVYELCGKRADRRTAYAPFSWRAILALAHKGIPFERRPITMTEKDEVAFSGQGWLPVLVDPNQPEVPFITDSLEIARYLDAKYPENPLFPCPSSISFIISYTATQVHPLVTRLCFDDLCRAMDPDCQEWYYSVERGRMYGRKDAIPNLQVSEKEMPGVIAKLRKALEPVRQTLREWKFLGGDKPHYGDYVLFSTFQWFRAVSPTAAITLEPTDPVSAWRSRMLDLFDGLARKAPGFHDWDPSTPEYRGWIPRGESIPYPGWTAKPKL